MSYHDSVNNTELAKINQLQQEIEELNQQNGTFNLINNPFLGKKYYEIYPTREDTQNGTLQEMILYKHPRNNINCAAYVAIVSALPETGNFNLIYKEADTSIYYY